MKKSPFPAALLLLGLVLAGCPVYESDDDDCFSDRECPYGSVCDGHTNRCVAEPTETDGLTCQRPSDCGPNETCNRVGTCSTGDCHFASVGCVRGYECSAESGRWECVKPGSSVSDGGNGGASSAGAPSLDGGAGGTPNGGSAGASG
jgi:hypothetical protein